MPNRHPVEDAERILRELLDLPPSSVEVPSIDRLVEALRQFAEVDFDVDEADEGDEIRIEYGAQSWLPPPRFVVEFVRQFDITDSDGQHDHFVELQVRYRYAIDDELEDRDRSESWFKPGGGVSFGEWLDEVMADPVWPLLRSRTAEEFVLVQEAT